jgi:hypothetical protein
MELVVEDRVGLVSRPQPVEVEEYLLAHVKRSPFREQRRHAVADVPLVGIDRVGDTPDKYARETIFLVVKVDEENAVAPVVWNFPVGPPPAPFSTVVCRCPAVGVGLDPVSGPVSIIVACATQVAGISPWIRFISWQVLTGLRRRKRQ